MLCLKSLFVFKKVYCVFKKSILCLKRCILCLKRCILWLGHQHFFSTVQGLMVGNTFPLTEFTHSLLMKIYKHKKKYTFLNTKYTLVLLILIFFNLLILFWHTDNNFCFYAEVNFWDFVRNDSSIESIVTTRPFSLPYK
jgi:hypothetical protein